MTDIASLSFNVDSGPAQASFLQLANAAQSANLSVSAFMAGLVGGQTQLAGLAGSLQQVVTAMQQARGAMDGSAASFEVFSKARNEAQLLGNILGTTALGIENFARASSQMNMTAMQTATALERITMAIEGQSTAARQLRTIMQDYGVSLQGISASNADEVLIRFAERVRGFQLTPGSIQNIQQVLGPQDVNSLAQLTAQPINQTADMRATQLKIEQVNRDAAATTDAAAAAYAQLRQGFEQLRSLQGVRGAPGLGGILAPVTPAAFSGGAYDLNRLTPAQLEQVNQGAGLVGAPDSTATQLARDRWLDTQAPQALRDAARNPFSIPIGGTPEQRAAAAAQTAANATNIEARRAEDRFYGTDFGSTWLGSGISRDLRNLQNNLLGTYTPTTIRGPVLPVDPNTLREQQLGLGAQLGGYGAPDFARSVGAGINLDALTRGGAVSDAERAFIQAYSTVGGPGATAGTQRYTNALDIAQRGRDTALVPGQGQLNDIALQQWILAQPREQQGQAQQLLTFAAQQGVSTQAIAARGLTPTDLIGGRATGPGALATDQAASFRAIQEGQSGVFQTETMQGLRQNLADEQALQAVIPQGTAALQTRTAAQQAYNAALAAGRPEQDRRLAAFRAEQEQIEKTNTAGLTLLDTLRRQNEQEGARQRATDQFSGADPVGRMAASQAAQNQAAADDIRRRAPGQADAIIAQQQRQQTQGALGEGANALATAQTQLADQQRLVDIARQRNDQQQRLNSDLQVEQDFRKRIADAMAAGGDGVALLQAEMRAVQQLRAEWDATAQAKKNYDAATLTSVRGALQEYRNTLSPAEQRRFDALRGSVEANLTSSDTTGNREADLARYAQRESGNQNIPQRSGGPASGYWQMEDRSRGGSGTWEEWAQRAGLPELPGGGYGRAMDYTREQQHAAAAVGYDQRGGQPWASSAPGAAASGAAAVARAREMMAGSGTPSEQERIAADQRARIAAEAGQNQEAQRAADYQRARTAAVTGSIRGGEGQFAQAAAGAAVPDPTSATAAADAHRRLNQVLDEYAQKRAELFAGNDLEIRTGTQLLNATQQGTRARQEAIIQIDVDRQARILNLDAQEKERLKTEELTLAINRQRQSILDAAQARKDQAEVDQANINVGPLASSRAIGEARARVLAAQEERTLGGRDYDTALEDYRTSETTKQNLADVQQLRQGFLQMEGAAMSAFDTAVVGGQKLSEVVRALVQDLAKLSLRTFVDQPVINAFNRLLGGVSLGGGGGLLSGAGEASLLGTTEAALTGPVGSGLLSAGLGLATGGVVNRGRWMATGGMIDRPITFMAEGGPITAGESGPEAILPLKRLASGNLGVATDKGGGSGHSITVHAPITIQGGAVGKNGMDPAAARAMQGQVMQVMSDAMRSMIVNELRDGGDIRVHMGR